MAAATLLCGRKRSSFEDLLEFSSAYKKPRHGSFCFDSPVLENIVQGLFDGVEPPVLESVLETQSAQEKSGFIGESNPNTQQQTSNNHGDTAATLLSGWFEDLPDQFSSAYKKPRHGSFSFENHGDTAAAAAAAIVKELACATCMDEATLCATKLLETFEKNLRTLAREEAGQIFDEENIKLKEENEGLRRDNGILKRAVVIQHEREKQQHEDNSRELQNLKNLVQQYQEQLKNLEVNNYALTMHLKLAQ